MEWLDHLVPLQLLRALWDALFPSRFERIVVESIDGTPPAGYPRPITFSIGCWLLFFAVAQAFPWAFATTGVSAVLNALPAAERHQVADRLGISAIPGLAIADTGLMSFGRNTRPAAAVVRARLGRRAGRVTASEVAGYLESHGDAELGLRVRGFAARANEKSSPFDQTTLVMFVVFGLVPGWLVSHLILHSARRTVRETRRVHMYNDSWLVVTCLIPLSVATYSGEAFATPWPQRMLAAIGVAALLVWMIRTVRLFRLTHQSPAWRTMLAHAAGLGVALLMSAVFSVGAMALRDLVHRAGL